MIARSVVALIAVLFASACTHSPGQSAGASHAAAAPGGSGALEGIKYRVAVYPSNLTAPPQLVRTGVYQFQTSDSVPTVLAWYKSHVPSVGGVWDGSGDASSAVGNQDWGYDNAHPQGGVFSVAIQHARSDQPGYAPNTKTIVEVTDR